VTASFERGDKVRINGGVFAHFTGVVADVNTERKTLTASVTIFSRAVPLQLKFTDVKKLN